MFHRRSVITFPVSRSECQSATTSACRFHFFSAALGIYRLWRDFGYVVGALWAGLIADLVGMGAAIHTVAALTLLSGGIVALRMYETLPGKRKALKTRETDGSSVEPKTDPTHGEIKF